MSTDVGHRLYLIRMLNGWSQRELAKRAGVTNSTISMIEQGKVSPSVSSLQKVLDGVPMSLADFFTLNLNTEAQCFYKADEFVISHYRGAQYALLAANHPNRIMSVEQMVLPPGGDTGPEMLVCAGEKSGIVIEGRVEIAVAGDVRLLQCGDGFYFLRLFPHRFSNTSTENCVVVVAKERK